MNTNKLIFSQVMDHLPLHTFRRCVSRYHGNRYVKKFRCYEQYLVMAFSQLTHRESLRDIEVCLRAHQKKPPFDTLDPRVLTAIGRVSVFRTGRWSWGFRCNRVLPQPVPDERDDDDTQQRQGYQVEFPPVHYAEQHSRQQRS